MTISSSQIVDPSNNDNQQRHDHRIFRLFQYSLILFLPILLSNIPFNIVSTKKFDFFHREKIEFIQREQIEDKANDHHSNEKTTHQEQKKEHNYQRKKNRRENIENNNNRHGPSQNDAALVVCGVDGTVYMLDAWTGSLRGLFVSGPALVSSSSLENENEEYSHDEFQEEEEEEEEELFDDEYFDEIMDDDELRTFFFQDTDNNLDTDNVENFDGHTSTFYKSTSDDEHTRNKSTKRTTTHSESSHQRRRRRREQIVPGLDGHIYTLTHEESQDEDIFYDDDDDAEDYIQQPNHKRKNHKQTKNKKHDGNQNVRLDVLPVSVMDVTESPVSTCSQIEGIVDGNEDDYEEECGIVMGEKQTKVFALDVVKGTVKWMQRPSSGEMGFTSSLRDIHGAGAGVGGTRGDHDFTFSSQHDKKSTNKTNRKSRSVLLQREDYFVRKIDADSGEEWWNVTVAHFSALDFSSSEKKTENGVMGTLISEDQHGVFSGDRHRRETVSSAATKTTTQANGKKKGNPVGVSQFGTVGRSSIERRPSSFTGAPNLPVNDRYDNFEDIDFKTKESKINSRRLAKDDFKGIIERDPPLSKYDQFWSFPSIAFGEDGTSITAISNGEYLWTRRIDSIVAAVYGVGKENRWISLDVADETEEKREQEQPSPTQNLVAMSKENFENEDSALVHTSLPLTMPPKTQLMLPEIGTVSSSLIPFIAKFNQNGMSSTTPFSTREIGLARLARHLTTLFITSTTQHATPFSGNVRLQIKGPQQQVLLPGTSDESESLKNIVANQINHNTDTHHFIPPENKKIVHQTKEGVFLTWRMVICLVSLVIGAFVGVRSAHLKQKREWMPASYKRRTTLPHMKEEENSSSTFHLNSASTHTLNRSLSLPQLNTSNRGATDRDQKMIDRDKKNDRFVENGENTIEKSNIDISSTAIQDFKNSQQTKKTESGTASITSDTVLTTSKNYSGIDTIAGFPLVRYSRYESEFKELSSLGKGGFGTVFSCINVLDSRKYAIKKIRIKSYLDPSGEPSEHLSAKLTKVLREVKILALLDHNNIVRYYTAWLEVEKEGTNEFCDEDELGTTMEYTKKGFSTATPEGSSSFSLNPFKMSTNNLSREERKRNKNTQYTQNNLNPLHYSGFDIGTKSSQSFSNDEKSNLNSSSIDLGFHWERSTSEDIAQSSNTNTSHSNTSSTIKMATHQSQQSIDNSESSDSTDSEDSIRNSYHNISSNDEINEESIDCTNIEQTSSVPESKCNVNAEHKEEKNKVRIQKHILYIQMQLCSQKTLAHFLASPSARKHGDVSYSSSSENLDDDDVKDSAIDITFAIRIFSQVVRAVKHVHGLGLIHRDLKPSNCFIDDTGVVKVGDFGLSRSATSYATEDEEGLFPFTKKFGLIGEQNPNNTAGIGTRSYASPEQMNGSDYDASTDVYSLGIMLFELCYPMYTGMERILVFENVRKRIYPLHWHESVKKSFPTLHTLIHKMLSDTPSERPSAFAVADSIEALLSEYTVQSLDRLTSQRRNGSLLLRVEADDIEGILPMTVRIIKEASSQVEIVQYGLRGQEEKAIMEFAVSFLTIEENGIDDVENADDHDENVSTDLSTNSDSISKIFSALKSNEYIKVVRKVSDQNTALDSSVRREMPIE